MDGPSEIDIELLAAYELMVEAGYSPLGVASAAEYVIASLGAESEAVYIGTPDQPMVMCRALAIEAARCACRPSDARHIRALLQLALVSLES